ncbi:hypothetical protein [Companilactobacillus zhongbaensis]|uniref:hypothetical protein n=1 Tax=Companilactobacillus zhongbaensis TaxID=2486009 RepID=UPI0013DE68D6|nr:hypothetical protein [Companilactobacillus zhongbaensis]
MAKPSSETKATNKTTKHDPANKTGAKKEKEPFTETKQKKIETKKSPIPPEKVETDKKTKTTYHNKNKYRTPTKNLGLRPT